MVTIMTKEIVGLIIRVVDYKESSLIIHVLTDKNIESIIARGVKKLNSKMKGYILSYNYVKCYVSDGKIPILTDISVINEYSNIQNNIRKNMYAGQLINMLYKEKYENDKVYELASKTIKFINDSNEEYYYLTFLLKNLYFMGLGLSINSNEEKELVGFNITESRVSTKSNNLNFDINKDNTISIFNLYFSKLEDVIDIDLIMLNDFLEKYYQVHASIKL